jgi:TfoX/Sxy family transcriptional regulator of competence genes
MASKRSIVDFLVDQLGDGASAKAMFGEYGVYVRGRLIGLVCDDRFFLKPTTAAAGLLGEHELGSPYPGAKPAIIVPEDLWDDPSLMARLAASTAEELGPASPRTKARRRKG